MVLLWPIISEASNLGALDGSPTTEREKRIAPQPDMESVWKSEPVKTNMKIIDVASQLDSYDWCLRCDCENV